MRHERSCADDTQPETAKVIEIDGSLLEGGGQSNFPFTWLAHWIVLRNTAAYAAITGKPVHIQNIRSKRTIPGIKAQQLSGLEFVAEISNGIIHGGHVGCTEIILQPGNSSEQLASEFVIYQKLGYCGK